MAIPIKYNLRNLRIRWVTSLLTVLGIVMVTVVFVMLFAMGLGMERSLKGSGDPLGLIALRVGTTAESQSVVTKQQLEDVMGIPGLLRDAEGELMVSAELVEVSNAVKQDGRFNVTADVKDLSLSARHPQVRLNVRRRVTPAGRDLIDDLAVARQRDDRQKPVDFRNDSRRDMRLAGVAR